MSARHSVYSIALLFIQSSYLNIRIINNIIFHDHGGRSTDQQRWSASSIIHCTKLFNINDEHNLLSGYKLYKAYKHKISVDGSGMT